MTNEEEAIKRIREFGLHHALGDLPYSAHTVTAFEMAIEALENQPKHGHWINTGRANVLGYRQHKCSVCGYSLMVSLIRDNENYCCNCGSKMDEEIEE